MKFIKLSVAVLLAACCIQYAGASINPSSIGIAVQQLPPPPPRPPAPPHHPPRPRVKVYPHHHYKHHPRHAHVKLRVPPPPPRPPAPPHP